MFIRWMCKCILQAFSVLTKFKVKLKICSECVLFHAHKGWGISVITMKTGHFPAKRYLKSQDSEHCEFSGPGDIHSVYPCQTSDRRITVGNITNIMTIGWRHAVEMSLLCAAHFTQVFHSTEKIGLDTVVNECSGNSLYTDVEDSDNSSWTWRWFRLNMVMIQIEHSDDSDWIWWWFRLNMVMIHFRHTCNDVSVVTQWWFSVKMAMTQNEPNESSMDFSTVLEITVYWVSRHSS